MLDVVIVWRKWVLWEFVFLVCVRMWVSFCKIFCVLLVMS